MQKEKMGLEKHVQGDQVACSKPPIDIDVNGRFETSCLVTLYRNQIRVFHKGFFSSRHHVRRGLLFLPLKLLLYVGGGLEKGIQLQVEIHR